MTIRTHSSRSWIAALAIAFLLCVAPAAQSQSQQAETKVTVDLGSTDGPPGRTVSVPLNIAVPEGIKVTEVELDVRFEKALLSFTRADLAPQGKADGVKLTTSLEDDPEKEGRSILRIKAIGGQAISSGAIADIFFRINPKAKPPAGSTGHKAAKVTAVLKKDARVKVGDGKLAAASGRDGEIDITAGTALFGCFFYMH